MDILEQFLTNISLDEVILTCMRITMILVFAWLAMKVLSRLLNRLEKRLIDQNEFDGEPPSESEKRVETIIRLLRQACMLAIWLTMGLVILKELGVQIAPIIASAGILGLAVGFGAQNLVRDVISGFFIILENQIRIGDVAKINGETGFVEKINFRTTVIRDLSGVVHIYPNGHITEISNYTYGWSAYVFDIGVAYKESTDHVVDIIKRVGKEMREDVDYGKLILEEPMVFGVDQLADSAVVIKGRIVTKPIKQWDVGREFLRRIKYAFDAEGIEIPFPHRSIYFGEASKAFDIKSEKSEMTLQKS